MKNAVLCALGALLISTLACSIFVGGPSAPTEAAVTPTPNGLSIDQQIEQSVAGVSPDGTITIQLTESQLTGYVAAALQGQTNPVLSEPRVLLQDGHMIVYGKATSGPFSANVSMTMQATVDSAGQPQIAIEQTDFGPIPVPQGLNEALSASVQEAFTGWIGPVATGFRLENISIADGVMTVTGKIK